MDSGGQGDAGEGPEEGSWYGLQPEGGNLESQDGGVEHDQLSLTTLADWMVRGDIVEVNAGHQELLLQPESGQHMESLPASLKGVGTMLAFKTRYD